MNENRFAVGHQTQRELWIATVVREADERLGLTLADVAAATNVDAAMLERCISRDGLFQDSPQALASFDAVERLGLMLESLFHTRSAAAAWLAIPSSELDGRSPVQELRLGAIGRVSALVNGIYAPIQAAAASGLSVERVS